MDIFALFRSFCQVHSTTVLRQLSAIIAGALCAPQHITMRNIARWSMCSYRTIQRFFATPIHWPSLHTAFVTTHLYDTAHPYILAFDETTITKSGKKPMVLISIFWYAWACGQWTLVRGASRR